MQFPQVSQGRTRSLTVAAGLAPLLMLVAGCSGAGTSAPSTNPCAGLVCIETVNVADAGNPADQDTGHGAVGYDYAIGAFEISVSEYLAFLNAVAAIPSSPAIEELWVDDMQDTKAYVSPGLIARTGSGTVADPYAYSEVPDPALGDASGRRGVLNVSWFSAARFANWLHNGATVESSTETGAYTLDGATSGVFARNPDAQWWIPSDDEWYKAAYYDPAKPGSNQYWTYPTKSDELPAVEPFPGGANSANFNGAMPEGQKITPAGAYTASVSAYGTYDQAGLLWEWNDAIYPDFEGTPITRGMRGGSWSLGLINASKFGPRDYEPTYSDDDTGFRLATNPR